MLIEGINQHNSTADVILGTRDRIVREDKFNIIRVVWFQKISIPPFQREFPVSSPSSLEFLFFSRTFMSIVYTPLKKQFWQDSLLEGRENTVSREFPVSSPSSLEF